MTENFPLKEIQHHSSSWISRQFKLHDISFESKKDRSVFGCEVIALHKKINSLLKTRVLAERDGALAERSLLAKKIESLYRLRTLIRILPKATYRAFKLKFFK